MSVSSSNLYYFSCTYNSKGWRSKKDLPPCAAFFYWQRQNLVGSVPKGNQKAMTFIKFMYLYFRSKFHLFWKLRDCYNGLFVLNLFFRQLQFKQLLV